MEKEEEIEVEITASTLRLGQYLRVHDRVHANIVPQLIEEFGKNERNGGMTRIEEIKEKKMKEKNATKIFQRKSRKS